MVVLDRRAAVTARVVQRGAAEDVVLRDLDRLELEQVHDLGEDHDPREDRDRTVRVKALDLAALLERHRRQAIEDRVAFLCAQDVTLHVFRVVGVELLGDRRERGRRAGDTERAAGVRAVVVWDCPIENVVHVFCDRFEFLGGRRVGTDVAVGLAYDAGLGRDVEVDPVAVADHELGRAAADVEDERRLGRRGRRRHCRRAGRWRPDRSVAPPHRR